MERIQSCYPFLDCGIYPNAYCIKHIKIKVNHWMEHLQSNIIEGKLLNPGMGTYNNKKITVFGANRSGIAIAILLHGNGAKISITDSRKKDELSDELRQLNELEIDFFLGGHSEDCIKDSDLIVVSPGVPLDIPILEKAKQDGIKILGELEVAARHCPAPIIAITGTKGKSTTTLLTAAILEKCNIFNSVVVAGNIGVPLSSKITELTPKDICVVEVSSFQLETTKLFCPLVSVVLNLSRDHLDRHGTMEAYFTAKSKICKNQTESEWIVLNITDEYERRFAENTYAQKTYFSDDINSHTSSNNWIKDKASRIGAELRIKNEKIGLYSLNHGRANYVCDTEELPLAGAHNIRNVLAAIVVGTILGIQPSIMRKALLDFTRTHPALEHAFEKVATINGVDYINDSKATNVIATNAALESIDRISMDQQYSKRVILIMGGYDKGNDYSSLVEPIQRHVKSLILLGEHTHNIQTTFNDCCNIDHVSKMDQAVELAEDISDHGDIVLLSPANASFDMYSDYKARGEAFKKAVLDLS
ncbi:UDP-N-acetylmuramoyl-L-alanine--D-glutamate ligase [Candidatus Poribacteria bacterium]|nr:MAG: UDP-N-acetylmuramoyl-L-alanine--D-glutamate ligase [Candidatus Poribacteria bacterium]